MKGEDRFVASLRDLLAPCDRVLLGPGDDAAVIATPHGPLLATTDLCIENVDFLSDESPEVIGRRSFAVNLSDLAAMGGRPEFFLLSIGFRRGLGEEFPLGICRGALSLAEPFDARLVGGDLSAASETIVSIALWGTAPAAVLARSGARPGDLLFVSGWPGQAAAGLRIAQRKSPRTDVRSGPDVPSDTEEQLLRAYRDPQPRVRLGLFLAEHAIARAAIDVSDGLGIDAGRMARASGVRLVLDQCELPVSPALAAFARIEDADPIDWILAGGDDYELLFAADPETAVQLEQSREDWGAPVHRIGRVEEGSGVILRTGAGTRDVSDLGHDHLESSR